jgi:hypothetical protein
MAVIIFLPLGSPDPWQCFMNSGPGGWPGGHAFYQSGGGGGGSPEAALAFFDTISVRKAGAM